MDVCVLPITASSPGPAVMIRVMIGGVGTSTAAAWEPSATQESEAKRREAPARRRAQAEGLSPEQQRVVAELQARDQEVRAHEGAHKAAGGSLAGGMSLSYQTGPDGRRYAVGGEVSIDTGSERDPQATIAKMRQVIAAALAPAQPSAQDRAVAAAARAAMLAAERQLREQDAQAKPPDAAEDEALRNQRIDLTA